MRDFILRLGRIVEEQGRRHEEQGRRIESETGTARRGRRIDKLLNELFKRYFGNGPEN